VGEESEHVCGCPVVFINKYHLFFRLAKGREGRERGKRGKGSKSVD